MCLGGTRRKSDQAGEGDPWRPIPPKREDIMRFIHPKGILVAALLLALPLWAGNRTGVLLTTNKQEGTKEQKLEWKKIKQVQDEVMKTLQSGNMHHMKHFKQKEGLPFVMIVSCADSRVPPETVFNLQPR